MSLLLRASSPLRRSPGKISPYKSRLSPHGEYRRLSVSSPSRGYHRSSMCGGPRPNVQKKLDFAGPSHVTSRPPIASVRLATSERLTQKPQTQTKSKKANAAPVVELAPFWYQENELSPDWVKVIPETEESRREQKTLRIKQELANSMKELFENKMIALRDGNVSMKPKGEDRFFITPGGVPKNTLKPEDVCEIPMDVEYTPPKKTGPRPSRETFMHKSVYMAFRERLDANKDMFVVHAHPPAILAYVGVEEGRKKQLSSLKSLFPEFLTTIGPNVPLLEAGSKDLADTCGANVQGVDLIVLENHGTISVGETLQEAMEALETVEYYASIANNAGLTPMPSLALQQPLQ